jgi:hypothetical protein
MAAPRGRDAAQPAGSPADAALAQGDVAGHIIGALLARAGGTAADLARLECVCRALRRAAAPHWRSLCENVSRAAAALHAAAAGSGVPPWRRLYAQLRTATFGTPPPRCRCTDFRWLLDVSFAGQTLLSVCLGPFAGEAHAAQRAATHWVGAQAPEGAGGGAPSLVVTAGDVYDWPTRIRATLFAQRVSDGALSLLLLNALPQTPVAWTQTPRAGHTAELEYAHYLSNDYVLDQASDSLASLPFRVQLFLQAQDAAEAASEAEADAVAPLFFRTPAFDAANDRGGSAPPAPGQPRRPLHESGTEEERGCHNTHVRRVYNRHGYYGGGDELPNGNGPDADDRVAIDECALARRLVLRRRGGVVAALSFGRGHREDGTPDEVTAYDAAHFAALDGCSRLCASLDRCAFTPP